MWPPTWFISGPATAGLQHKNVINNNHDWKLFSWRKYLLFISKKYLSGLWGTTFAYRKDCKTKETGSFVRLAEISVIVTCEVIEQSVTGCNIDLNVTTALSALHLNNTLRFPPPAHHINITESWPHQLQSIRGILGGNYYLVIIDQHLHKDSQIEQQVTFQSVSLFHIAGTGLLTKWVLAWLYNPLEVTRWRQIITTISPKPLRGRSSWD